MRARSSLRCLHTTPRSRLAFSAARSRSLASTSLAASSPAPAAAGPPSCTALPRRRGQGCSCVRECARSGRGRGGRTSVDHVAPAGLAKLLRRASRPAAT
uniref:Uncharacterized protein n=1 Tax=Arundo donax TaxID=35708 RepID=A0A0A9FDD9_ARUDO